MHRLIEDTLDSVVDDLAAVALSSDPGPALVLALPELEPRLRLVNRTMRGFRSPARMDRTAFVDGFRPYYAGLPPSASHPRLEGPSGLQSPTFRLLALRIGYADTAFDHWTRAILPYHEPPMRTAIESAAADRDAGRSLAAIDAVFAPSVSDPPHMHPAYGADAPDLMRLAVAIGGLAPDIEATLERLGLRLGAWPRDAGFPLPASAGGGPEQAPAPFEAVIPRGEPAPGVTRDVATAAARLEALLFGFHLEHVATTAHQIGVQEGTGGTSGVEFLLLATFRRGFPRLWLSGLGSIVAREAVGAAAPISA
jgi:hypothetical protein